MRCVEDVGLLTEKRCALVKHVFLDNLRACATIFNPKRAICVWMRTTRQINNLVPTRSLMTLTMELRDTIIVHICTMSMALLDI